MENTDLTFSKRAVGDSNPRNVTQILILFELAKEKELKTSDIRERIRELSAIRNAQTINKHLNFLEKTMELLEKRQESNEFIWSIKRNENTFLSVIHNLYHFSRTGFENLNIQHYKKMVKGEKEDTHSEKVRQLLYSLVWNFIDTPYFNWYYNEQIKKHESNKKDVTLKFNNKQYERLKNYFTDIPKDKFLKVIYCQIVGIDFLELLRKHSMPEWALF